jgi:hypothetical protein
MTDALQVLLPIGSFRSTRKEDKIPKRIKGEKKEVRG